MKRCRDQKAEQTRELEVVMKQLDDTKQQLRKSHTTITELQTKISAQVIIIIIIVIIILYVRVFCFVFFW